MSDFLQAALDLAAADNAIFPLKPRGKKPLTKNGFKGVRPKIQVLSPDGGSDGPTQTLVSRRDQRQVASLQTLMVRRVKARYRCLNNG